MAIIYEVGFKADTKSLQSQLSVISKDIDKAFNQSSGLLNANLTEGIKQATILETVLKRATTDKGTSFINMNIALKQAGTSVQGMVAGLSGAKMNGALNTFLTTFAQADRNIIGMSSKIKEMQRVLMQSVKFSFAQDIQRFVSGQIQAAIGYIQDLNKALTDIVIVAPELAGQMDGLAESIITAAQGLHVAAKEYAEAAIIFYQQGLDSDEVAKRTEVTVKSALASGQSMSEMADQLTAVWNTYQMAGEELQRSASIAAKLGADTAAEFSDISTGMQTAASGASMLGVSYESLAAIMATVVETTKQSASVIGNAYKTIFARFTNLTAAGEEGEVELGRITTQLAELGIRVLDADGNLRDLDSIINQLGNSWDSYSRKQQIAIAQVVGGVRQYQQFLALMQNFDKYQANLATAQSERGSESLDKQFLTAISSIDTQIKMSSESWKRALSGLFDTKGQMAFYSGLEKMGNIVESVIDNMGGLQGVLTFVGAYLIRQIIPAVTTIRNTLSELWNNRNIEAQLANIKKQTDLSIKTMDRMANISTINRGQSGFVGGAQAAGSDPNYYEKEKVRIAGEVAQANAYLNKVKQEGNEIDRQQAENLQRQLMNHQQLLNASIDLLQSKRQVFELEEKEASRATQRLQVQKAAAQQQNQQNIQAAQKELQKQQEILATMERKTKAQKRAYADQEKIVQSAQNAVAAAKAEAAQDGRNLKNRERELEIRRQIADIGKQQASILNPATEEKAIQQIQSRIAYLKDSLAQLRVSPSEESVLTVLFRELDENADVNVQLQAIASGLAAINAERAEGGGQPIVPESEIQNLLDTAEASDQLRESQERVGERVQESQSIWQRSGVSMQQFAQQALNMVSSVSMGIVMITNTIDNLGKKVAEGTVTLGDYLTAVAMLIPMLTSMMTSIISVAGSLAAMALASTTGAVASTADAVAKTVQAIAIKLLGEAAGGAVTKVMALTIAIAAAIVVLVAIVAIIVAVSNAIKAQREETLKQAQAQLEASNKANELRDSLVELRNSLQDLNARLKEGTLTTAEYSEAMEDLRQKVKELQEEHPDLKITLTGDLEGDLNRVNEAIKEANTTAIAEATAAQEKIASLNKNTDYMGRTTSGTKQFATGFWGSETDSIEAALARANINSQGIATEGFAGSSGIYDLTEIAANYTQILDSLGGATSELGQKFDAEMRKVDGFIELLGTVDALDIAESFNEYQKVLEMTGEEQAAYFEKANEDKKQSLILDEELKAAQKELAVAQADYNAGKINKSALNEIQNRVNGLKDEAEQAYKTAAAYDEMMQHMYADNSDEAKEVVQRQQATELLRNAQAQKLRQGGMTDEAEIIRLSFDVDTADVERAMALMDAGYEDLIGMEDTRRWAITQTGVALENVGTAFSEWDEDASSSEKVAQFEKINSQIELMNERIRGVPELGIAGLEGMDEIPLLTDEFLRMSEAEREAFLAAQELANIEAQLALTAGDTMLAESELATLQQELNSLKEGSNEYNLKEVEIKEKQEQIDGLRRTSMMLELDLTEKLNEKRREAIEALDSISSSDFVGSVDQQMAKFAELNQQLALLGLDTLSEDFLILTSAEQEQILALTRLQGAQNEYNRAVDAAGASSTAAGIAMKSLTQATADAFDLDADNLQDYAKHIQEVAKKSDILSDSLADNQKASLQVATATIRANRAFNDLDGKIGDIKKAFEEADEGSERFYDALNDIRGPMEDLLNVDPGTLSDSFLSNTEALDLLQAAVDGNTDALWQLQQMAASTYLAEIVGPDNVGQFQELEQAIWNAVDAGWELGELPNPELDNTGFIAACEELIRASGMSVDQANDYFKQLGFDMEFNTDQVTKPGGTQTIPATEEQIDISHESVTYPIVDNASGEVTNTTVQIPKIKKYTIDSTKTIDLPDTVETVFAAGAMEGEKGLIKGVTNTGAAGTKGGSAMRSKPNRGSGGKGTGGGGGKGGGGGGKANIAKATRDTSARERFTDITAALDGVAKSLDRVGKAEDKAFGANKLLLMQKKNKELQEQGKLYNNLIKEAEAYLKVDDRNQGMAFGKTSSGEDRLLGGVMGDIDRLKQMASIFKDVAGIDLTPEFNSEGYIANAEQMIDAINAKLQEQWDSSTYWNATEKTYAFTSEAAEASYNNLKEMADGYKEQIGTVDSTNDKMKEGLEKGLENIHTWLSNKLTEVEYKMELRIRINQRDIDQLQWLMGRLSKQASVAAMDNLETQVKYMLKNAKALSEAAERYLEIEKNLSAGSEHQSWFRKEFGEEAWNEYQKTGHITEEMMDKMTATAEEMQELIRQLWELNSQMWAMWHEALQGYIDEFDNLIGMYDSHASMIDSWANIWKVAGSPWKDQRLQIDLLNKSIDNQSSKVQGLQQKYEFLNSKIADAEALYQRALNDYADDPEGQIIIEERRKEWEELKTQALEAKADMMSEVSAMMDMIANAAAEAASVIVNEFTEGLSGIFSSVDSALDMFDQKKSIDNFFMNEEDLGFELSKMAREMQKEMEGVTDPELLEKYHSWMEKINGMYYDENGIKKANVQMTETELEILKAEFDLEKAQAAWKEQQAQKNAMRLARDASGNWSYLYSADGGEEDDTEADIEEKIHNIRKMHRDAADEASEMWLQVWAEYRKYIEEIDWQRYEQNEAYRNEVDTRMGWYEQQLDLHAGQIVKHNEAIDRSFEDMTLSVITDTKDMMDLNNLYKQNNQDLTDALKSNHDEYQLKAKETLEAVGISYDNLKNEIEDDTDAMMRKNKQNEEAIKKLRRTADTELEAIMRKTMAWADTWRDEIRSVIAALNELIQKIFEMEQAQAGGGGDFDRNTDYAGKIQDTMNDDSLSKEEQRRRVEADAERRWYKIVEARNLLDRERDGEKIDWSIYKGGRSDAVNIAGEWSRDLTSQSREQYIEEYLRRNNLYDTGGLATGPQVAGLAMDGKKEIVLNASDTENFLEAISIMRDGIASYLSNIGMKQAGLAGATHPQTSDTTSDQPPVIIQADFPNVTAREEIEAAFANLVNQAAQYKLKPRD